MQAYKDEFIKSLTEEDQKLLAEVILSERILIELTKAYEKYQDGPNAWPIEVAQFDLLTEAIQCEALDQVTRMKHDRLLKQKMDAGLIKHTTVSLKPQHYMMLKIKANKANLPVSNLVGLILDKFLDKVDVSITISD